MLRLTHRKRNALFEFDVSVTQHCSVKYNTCIYWNNYFDHHTIILAIVARLICNIKQGFFCQLKSILQRTVLVRLHCTIFTAGFRKTDVKIFPCRMFHRTFHVWDFTWEISRVKFHMWNFTYEISHVNFPVWLPMWNFTFFIKIETFCSIIPFT